MVKELKVWQIIKSIIKKIPFNIQHSTFNIILFAIVLSGCGYKPMTEYTKKVFTDKVYVDVDVYLRDPENAVLVKDALNEAVISRFNAKLTSKKSATTQLKVKFERVSFSPIQYDSNGYAIFYRAKVTLNISYIVNGKKGFEKVVGYYDFPIEPNAVISDAKRFEAIRFGAEKAIDSFVSLMSMRGAVL
ncbi:LPS assembly lipoprotein LptE [Hydrogenimonas thermophila]|uniref:LPS assembly lipoprotein LptE n=1 Tax=Hydrogenimonas thermophila TaxID=223786 RepID=UPI002936D78E|nr:LPS assembly lipoprotein LptE [Hydrogenimonas thermophila]WOE70317.1 LPS assembly lipoprotein LptE [Hydrogenimonas thermophila]WOE72834.1 LPS assembly lipoprotein LptE [Hydrogenimonas thermophila]